MNSNIIFLQCFVVKDGSQLKCIKNTYILDLIYDGAFEFIKGRFLSAEQTASS